jgi:hypothetical protein
MEKKNKINRRWFGLPALEGAKMAWGARAILDMRSFPYYLDLLHDRQGFVYEDQKEFDAFIKFLNKKIMPWIKKAATTCFQGSDNNVYTRHYEYEGKVIVAQLSPNGSCGYMYIACSLVEANADLPAEEYDISTKAA